MIKKFNFFINEKKYTNKILDKRFWNDNLEFDNKVRKKLIKISNNFFNTLNIDVDIEDILLTGSLANYNYNKNSDLDIHIVIDFEKSKYDKKIITDLLKTKAFVWNLKHDIIIRNADVEIYMQDKKESHISTGLFSLLNNKWIKKPLYTDPDVDEEDIKSKYDKWVNEIEKIEDDLNKKNLNIDEYEKYFNRTEKLKEKIRKFRKKGLHEGEGEFSIENIVFKKLRNNGYINKLYKISNIFYDMIFSQ